MDDLMRYAVARDHGDHTSDQLEVLSWHEDEVEAQVKARESTVPVMVVEARYVLLSVQRRFRYSPGGS